MKVVTISVLDHGGEEIDNTQKRPNWSFFLIKKSPKGDFELVLD